MNKILIEYFAKKESMFGVMKQTDLADLRDHKDLYSQTLKTKLVVGSDKEFNNLNLQLLRIRG